MGDFTRDLVIKVTRDDSEYLAKTRATYAAELQLLEKLKAASKSKGDVDKTAEKAKADAASEADRLIKQMDKAAADRQKADAKAKVARARETNAAIRQADKVMSDLIMADLRALTAADAAMAKARKESAADVAKVVRQVEAQTAADKRQWDKRELTDEEVQQRGISAIIRKANRDRVHDFVASHTKEKGLLFDLKEAWGGPLGAIAKAGGAVAGVTVGMGALKDVAVAALTAMDEKTRQYAESTRDATRALIDQHKKQLEISGFMGAPGETGPELAKSAKLAAASGLSIGEASDVRMAAEANAFSLVDKEAILARNGMPAVDAQKGVVSRPVYDKGIEMAAKLAAVSGGNPADYGKGVGTLINLEGKRIDDPSVIENRLLQNERLASVGKFATTSGLFDQVDKNLAFVKSGVIEGPELAGLTALYAEIDQKAAATLTKQALTAVSSGLMQARGIHIDDAFKAESTTTSGHFQSLGITQDTNSEDRLLTVARDLRAQKAKAKAEGRNFNAAEYLMQKGFGNQDSRQAIMTFEGKMDQWLGDIKPTLSKQFAPGTIDATHANFQKTFLGKANAVRTGGEIAQAAVGEKFGDLNLAMEAEYNRQLASGKEMSPLSEYMAPPARNALTGTFGPQEIWRSFKGTTQEELLAPIGTRLDQELDRLGINMDAVFKDAKGRPYGHTFSSPGGMLSSGEAGWQDVARVFNEAIGKIQAAGGDPSLGQGQATQEMVAELKGLRADLQQANRNNRPLVPPAPSAFPARIGNPP